jgi:type 1 glutamine amidotransferase
MSDKNRAVRVAVLDGGCPVHPARQQIDLLEDWLPDWHFDRVAGAGVFDRLADADLLIVAGLHWTGWPDITWGEPGPYAKTDAAQRQNFRDFVASGRPIAVIHGGMASFDDWIEFGQLLGFTWNWDVTDHSRVGDWQIQPVADSPLIDCSEPFSITDELYGHVQITPGMRVQNHLEADLDGLTMPLLLSAEGGRSDGAGRTAWFGLGHDIRAWEQPRFRPILENMLNWLLAGSPVQGVA